MRLKFWEKSQEDKPAVPDDIKYFQDDRAGKFTSGVQSGHVPTTAGVKAVVTTLVIFALVVVAGFLWLYFHQFLFSNDT